MTITKKNKVNNIMLNWAKILFKKISIKFDYLANNHFHLIMYFLVSLFFVLLTMLSLKMYFKININDEEKTSVEIVQVVEKVEIKEHLPARRIVVLRCEHEIFTISDDDLYIKVRDGEILYMKTVEYSTVIYIRGKEVNKEIKRIEYSFSTNRFSKDDGIYNEFDIFKKTSNSKII